MKFRPCRGIHENLLIELLASPPFDTIRQVEYAARYGGEELAIALPEMEMSDAMVMAERLLRIVEATRMDIGESHEVAVTISVGVAVHPTHGSTTEQLFEAADRAMYQAKQGGRNRVCLAVLQ